MPQTIMVVDDQSSVRQLVQDYLTEQGFRVVTASDGQNALYAARHEQPDLILLDIMMPRMDGYQFLRQFRQEKQTPVIIITAREEETDAVLGLDLGADDYVIKPFRMRELTARIHAVLRRMEDSPQQNEVLRGEGVELDRRTHGVSVNGVPVTLTPIEFDLLATLMRSPGKVFSRDELVADLTDSGFAGLESTLNVHIRNLRMKIEKDPTKPQLVETVFGIGYRFHREFEAHV
jgi:DNA-binding response OmpR family regulator